MPVEATTIQIAYVNEPKSPKGPGSIKDANGVYWTVWRDQLPNFMGKEGQTVAINFETKDYNGKPQYTIIGLAGTAKGMPKAPPRVSAPSPAMWTLGEGRVGVGSPPFVPPPAAGTAFQPVTMPPLPPLVSKPFDPAKRDENIAVLALVKIYEKQLQVGDRQALVAALRMCRSAWRELQTGDVRPTFQEDLNDAIPSFEEPGKAIEDTF